MSSLLNMCLYCHKYNTFILNVLYKTLLLKHIWIWKKTLVIRRWFLLAKLTSPCDLSPGSLPDISKILHVINVFQLCSQKFKNTKNYSIFIAHGEKCSCQMCVVECFRPSVQFSRSVVSDSLWPHESQHSRPPCPSPTPGVH